MLIASVATGEQLSSEKQFIGSDCNPNSNFRGHVLQTDSEGIELKYTRIALFCGDEHRFSSSVDDFVSLNYGGDDGYDGDRHL